MSFNFLISYSAWIPTEHIWSYVENRTKMLVTNRIPRGYKEAVEAMDDAVKALPTDVRYVRVLQMNINKNYPPPPPPSGHLTLKQ